MMHCLVSSENRFDYIYYFSISTYFLFSLYKLIVVLGVVLILFHFLADCEKSEEKFH